MTEKEVYEICADISLKRRCNEYWEESGLNSDYD